MVSFSSDGKAILAVFMGAIITLVFLLSIADSTFTQTSAATITNETVTAASTVNSSTNIKGRDLNLQIEIYNATGDPAEDAANAANGTGLIAGAHLQRGLGTNGLLSVQLVLNDTAEAFVSQSINTSYDYNPDGFASDGSTRSIINLIVLFGALAIVVFVIVTFIKDGTLGDLVRGS